MIHSKQKKDLYIPLNFSFLTQNEILLYNRTQRLVSLLIISGVQCSILKTKKFLHLWN